MAEVAVAALVAAAVSGVAYTVQYALTPKAKPIQKGRLSGDIQIQDSRYGHMIPILLGANPVDQTAGGDGSGEATGTARYSYSENSFFCGYHVALNPPTDDDPAPDFVTWSQNNGTEGFGSVEAPPGTQVGDLMLVEAHTTNEPPGIASWPEPGTPFIEPSEWTLIALPLAGTPGPDPDPNNQNWDGMHGGLWWKYADEDDASGAPTSYYTGGSFSSIVVYRGTHASSPIDVFDTLAEIPQPSAGPVDYDLPSITTLGSNRRVVAIARQSHGTEPQTITARPVGYTQRNNETLGLGISDKVFAGQSPTAEPGGGMRVAGNVIYMSDVRKVETVTPAEGGKGFGNKNPDTITTNYYCDLAIMFSEGEVSLAKLYAGTDLILDFERENATGVRDASVDPDDDADNVDLPSPTLLLSSSTPQQRYGRVVLADEEGTVTGTMAAGNHADFRFYSGTETQLPDPLLETHFGVGNTPAYLGRSYLVLENFEVGKYGAIPNFTAVLNNVNLKTAADCIDHLCQRVGLEPSDFDVSNVSAFNVRGIPIVNREGPRETIDLIGKLFGFDLVETNGELICVQRGSAPSFTVTEADLGAVEVEGTEDPQSNDIPELITNERQLDQTSLPRRVDVNFYDPERGGERNTAGVSRLEALANGFVTEEVNAVLTFTEARQLAQRLLDTAWIESLGAVRFSVPHTFADEIKPASVGTITRSGFSHTVRVKEVNGFVPGALEAIGILTAATTYDQTEIVTGEGAGAPITTPVTPSIPATTVATFIDRLLRDRELQDGRPGFYVAACSAGNGSWGSANVYADRGSGYVHLVNVPEQATMGVVDDTDATITEASEVDVELYADQTLPASGYVIQGHLVYKYGAATQLSISPNLWRVSDLSEIGARCTTGENGSHAAGERFVVLNQALRFVAIEESEIGIARDYKVPTAGADLNDTGVISFTVDSPNVAVTTPSDYSLTAGDRRLIHNWTPFADECVVVPGLVYEIYEDDAGSPGDLIYSGAGVPFVELGLEPGEYTRHFRVVTSFSEGDYEVRTATVLTIPGPSAFITSGDFITHFYQGAFARDPTGTELGDESALLVAAETSGVDYYAAAVDIGDRLFNSAEYLARGRDDEEFVTDLYRAYMARVPDEEGFAFWLAELAATDRDHLLEAFADSPEFRLRVFNVYGWHPEETGGGSGSVTRLFSFEFDGRGSAIDDATIPEAVLPFSPISGTIVEAYIKDLDDISGSCEIDVRAAPRGSAPPSSGQSLVGAGAKPSTTSQTESTLSDLSDWTSDHIDANDEVRAKVISNSSHKHLILTLIVTPD